MFRAIAVIAAALPLLTPALPNPAVLTPSAPTDTAVGQPASDPPTEPMRVEVLAVLNPGCPPGSVYPWPSGNTWLWLYYSGYWAQMGPGAKRTDLRQSCRLLLDVRAPAGYTYAISAVTYAAWIVLPEGATAQVRARQYFEGSPPPQWTPASITGPFEDVWEHRELAESLAWASCDEQRPLVIDTELRILPGTADPEKDEGVVALGEPPWSYGLIWRRC